MHGQKNIKLYKNQCLLFVLLEQSMKDEVQKVNLLNVKQNADFCV